MCECGDTWNTPCPRCQNRIDTAIDHRDHPTGDRADAAENRHDTYTLGDAA